MIFKNLQMSNNASQAGGREFEPRLPLNLKSTIIQIFILITIKQQQCC